MSIIERVLLIGLCIAPFVALLFVLPKLKKKKQKTFETTDYVPEKKEEPAEPKPEIIEAKMKEKSYANEIESYREFLEKRKESMSKPSRVQLPKDYRDLTESYSAMRRREMRNQQERNTNINNLDPEIKALLIAGILDRKF